MIPETGRRRLVVLLAGDWLALALFVFLGQLDHNLIGENPLPRLLTTTVQLALPWTAVALIMGAYRFPSAGGKPAFMWRSLNAWLVAAPLALLLRAWLNGQAAIVVIFFVIVLGLGGALLLGWRAVFALLMPAGLGHQDKPGGL